MCASPSTIREIMLAAAELNMVNSGEYVFFNIEIFGRYVKQRREGTVRGRGNQSHGFPISICLFDNVEGEDYPLILA